MSSTKPRPPSQARGAGRRAQGASASANAAPWPSAGKGSRRYSNGDFYQGEFQDGDQNGEGVCQYANGTVYEGQFREGKPHGRGVRRTANGITYEGDFVNGLPQRQGVCSYSNGTTYQGEWKEGRMNGSGMVSYEPAQVLEPVAGPKATLEKLKLASDVPEASDPFAKAIASLPSASSSAPPALLTSRPAGVVNSAAWRPGDLPDSALQAKRPKTPLSLPKTPQGATPRRSVARPKTPLGRLGQGLAAKNLLS